ncbi:MAG: 1-acyl-sn-glycerol-3-phosphate acyltransferase [Actinobacteria bacterium]|nr:1-acyl-sn-glycerol-3-phosphate acyltransferase [Actinomycetota bacterium]
MEVEGAENLPREGGVLIASNHCSYLDPPLMGNSVDRQVHFMAKKELFKVPVLGFCISHVGTFPVARGTADRSAIRKAIEYLSSGEVVGIFPEGTRTKSGTMKDGEIGAAMLAAKAGVPILPMGIRGNIRVFQMKGIVPKFSKLKVRIGKPIEVPLQPNADRKQLKAILDKVMEEIRKLVEE